MQVTLDWVGCLNARDLGGLATTDGATIRPGALVRTGCHSQLTPAGVRAVRDSGVSRIIDLRWVRECADRPSPFAGTPIYRNMPLLDDPLTYIPLPETYARMLDHSRPRIGAVLRAVAEAPPGGVVVHCKAGRDRTGAVVALLLSLAGVPDEVIADDYARTDGCDPTPMLNTMVHLAQRYGGIVGYLEQVGVDAGQRAALRARLRATG